MGIIGVNPGRREPQQRQQPQTSELDKNLNRILAAVNIANQGFGFALKFDEQDRIQAQTELLQKQQGAVPTPEQVQQTQEQALHKGQVDIEEAQARTGKLISEAGKISAETPTPEQVTLKQKQAREDRAFKVAEDKKKGEKTSLEIAALKNAPALQNETRADKLADRRIKNPITKVTQDLGMQVRPLEAYQAGLARGEAPDFANDQALIKIREKILDQGSVVREGEFDMARKGGELDDAYLGAMLARLDTGAMLTDSQREDLFNSVGRLWEGQMVAQRQVDNVFRDIAKRRNLNIDDVILKTGQFESALTTKADRGGAPSALSGGTQPPAQFSEEEIKAVMEGANVDRGQAVLRLRAAMGGQ